MCSGYWDIGTSKLEKRKMHFSGVTYPKYLQKQNRINCPFIYSITVTQSHRLRIWSDVHWFCFSNYKKCEWDTSILLLSFPMMNMNNVWGDLTNISAKTKHLWHEMRGADKSFEISGNESRRLFNAQVVIRQGGVVLVSIENQQAGMRINDCSMHKQ